jgi:uncharacterized membrane protein HdeD (DUF308 family)
VSDRKETLAMTAISVDEADLEFDEPDLGMPFWLLFTIGILWILVSFVILQFTYTSILTIAILIGLVLLFAAVSEFALAFAAPGWKWAHALLGVLFVAGGIWSFAYPGQTFGTLALLFGWYLLIKGTFDIVLALHLHGTHLWWMGLVAGIIEIAVAFWAVGYPGRSAVLLVIWVGIGALMRGITALITAFQVRALTRGAN